MSNRVCPLGGLRPIACFLRPTVSVTAEATNTASHQSRTRLRVRCASNAGRGTSAACPCFIGYYHYIQLSYAKMNRLKTKEKKISLAHLHTNFSQQYL